MQHPYTHNDQNAHGLVASNHENSSGYRRQKMRPRSITPQHTLHQIPKRTPVILPAGQLMFVNEEDIVFEAGVEMGLETQVHDDRVMVAVDVCVDAVQAFEDLPDQSRESLGERDAYQPNEFLSGRRAYVCKVSSRTDLARKHLFIVDVALNPAHQMFDIIRGGHFRRTFVILRVLPEILEPEQHRIPISTRSTWSCLEKRFRHTHL